MRGLRELRTFKERVSNLVLRLRFIPNTWIAPKGDSDSFRLELPRPMTYTPQQIANYFLNRSFEEGIPLSVMKLLKLVYIAYGWNWALRGAKLFDEPIEAWEHGPVIPTLYHEFKHYRKRGIREFAEDYDEFMIERFCPHVPRDDSETLTMLAKVWAAYKKFSAWALREKTHEVGGPWHKVYDPTKRCVNLNDADIRDHYEIKISQYLDAADA